jgi:hypothetical protein
VRYLSRVTALAALVTLLAMLRMTGAAANHTTDSGVRCRDFDQQQQAQGFLRQHPYDAEGLDGPPGPNNGTGNRPGVACDMLSCPCDVTPVHYTGPVIATTIPNKSGLITSTSSGFPTLPTALTTTTLVTTTSSSTPFFASPVTIRQRTDDGRPPTPLLAGAGGLVFGAYLWWNIRDRRRVRLPIQNPRWPTEW